jgi:hypothetical protein
MADTVYLASPGIFQRHAQEHPKVAALAKEDKLSDWQWRWVGSSQRYLLRHDKNPRECIDPSTLNMALRRMGYKSRLTGHGLRATLSTVLSEIGYPAGWIEAQLSHADPNAIRGAYNHAKYVEQRRRMMQDWADRPDCLEQGRVEEATRHLVVHLENVAERPTVLERAPRQFVQAAWKNRRSPQPARYSRRLSFTLKRFPPWLSPNPVRPA